MHAFFLVALMLAPVLAKDGPPPATEALENALESESSSDSGDLSESESASDSEELSDSEGSSEQKWEFTLASALERRAGQTVYQAPILEVSYYLRDDLLLDFIAPWTVLRHKSKEAKSGMGNWQTAVQWQFLDEETFGVSALVFPRLEFNAPGSSSADRGLVQKGMTFSLPVQVGRTFGPIGIAVEAGYSFIEYGIDDSFYSLAAVYSLSDRMELLSQFLGTAQRDFKEGDAAFTIGVRWWLSDHVALLVSAGKGLYDSQGNTAEFISSFGFQFSY